MRVVSVLPSATEIVHHLGRGGDLVGRSEECDYPASVRELPVVMRARTRDVERTSAEIDARVRSVRAEGEGLYELDVGRIAELRPDLVLTQDLCRVCSVTDSEVAEACARAGIPARILSISPTRLEEVWGTVETIAEALGIGPEGRRAADRLRRRTPAPGGAPRPTVAVLEWIDPPIEAGLWTPELVASGGGRAWGPVDGGTSRRLTFEELRARPPELVLVSPCSFSVDRTRRELGSTELGRQLERLRSPLGVWVADEAYFSRPGPRLADGRDLVADLVAGRPPRDPATVIRWDAPGPSVPP